MIDESSSVERRSGSSLGLDPARQVRARTYAYQRLALRGLSLLLSLLGLAVLGLLGAAPALRHWVQGLTADWPLEVVLFFAVLGGASSLLTVPLTYYRGFVLPHRYGLSNQSLRDWLLDLLKAGCVGALLGLSAIEVVYLLLRAAPDTWWVWTWLASVLFSSVLTTLAPIVIVPLFFKLVPLHDESLAATIASLARRAGTGIRDVREINLSAKTPAANAAVVGMGKTRKIVLGDTLLEEFSRDEVEVVVAHELGHHVHHDLAKGLALDAALSLPGFLLADVALHLAVRSWHFAGVWDLGAFPVLALTFGVWSAVSAPLARAHSRRVEASADAFSIALTGKGQAFVDGEIRLTNQNLAWFHPPTWLEALFYTHPAPWRRVAMGEKHLRDGEVSV